jgi:hypothetical protein
MFESVEMMRKIEVKHEVHKATVQSWNEQIYTVRRNLEINKVSCTR